MGTLLVENNCYNKLPFPQNARGILPPKNLLHGRPDQAGHPFILKMKVIILKSLLGLTLSQLTSHHPETSSTLYQFKGPFSTVKNFT